MEGDEDGDRAAQDGLGKREGGDWAGRITVPPPFRSPRLRRGLDQHG
jgi:hypothetical protein